MKIIIKYLLALAFLNCTSCNSSNKPLNNFFIALEQNILTSELHKFKNSPNDSVTMNFYNFYDNFLEVYDDTIHSLEINHYFNSRGIGDLMEYRAFYLAFAFHSILNNDTFNNDSVLYKVQNQYKLIMSKIKQDKEDNERITLEIVQSNNEKWNINDTINIILPVKFGEGTKSTYYSMGYPYSMDYSSADDTLKLKGILLSKRYELIPNSNLVDSTEFVFKLKIIELSNENYEILWRKYKIGDEFDLHLKHYARPIE